MDRRSFTKGLVGSSAAAALAGKAAGRAGPSPRLPLYSSVDDTLTHYELDAAAATLTPRASVTLPSAIQYVWPHPDGGTLYACTSDAPGGSGPGAGSVHRLCALRVAPDGGLSIHGAAQSLPQRPINNSVDAAGRFALTCYSSPAAFTVHRIGRDGALGEPVTQPQTLDLGIYAHQIRTLPGNRSVVMVTRGNNAGRTKPEDPGALKLYRFRDGVLSPLASIAVGGQGGYGYGPRHLDFHPGHPWAYVSIERQNQLHMHRIEGDGLAPVPSFITSTTLPVAAKPIHQVAGAIHVHPRGHVVYVSNRASGTVPFGGQQVFAGGENSIAVFAIDPVTGEPRLIQSVDPQGYHVRAFTIDPSGRLLIAALMIDMLERDGETVRRVPGGLSLFRIAPDGTLSFVGKHALELGSRQQLWVGTNVPPG